ncbi:MAG TPA: hypothetical protein VFV71_07880 [Burkholderiales bacterium]|nr:hypothetical protein [Burkholderiales bacterium]
MEIATREVMDQHVWSGEKSLETGLTQEQMIEKIRQAKAKQRTAADKAGGNSTAGADGG